MAQAPYDSKTDSDRQKTAKSNLVKTKPIKTKPVKSTTTPMMEQFLEIKANNPKYLLFYRMGDFYELFFEDAIIASAALGIALTKRGKHNGQDIPMCGVPARAHDIYLKKLIGLGHKVALCEQMENPKEAKKRGAKSVVRRDVVRLISSGTITEDDLLPAHSNNFLCAIAMVGQKEFALAWADISTGETWVSEVDKQDIFDELAKINPAEILISSTLFKKLEGEEIFPSELVGTITQLDPQNFDSEKALIDLKMAFSEFDSNSYSRHARSALGALVSYVSFSQKSGAVVLRSPNVENVEQLMAIDSATRSSLELLLTNRGEAKGSLKSIVDKCVTGAGSRLLAQRLASPLLDMGEIIKRLDMVEAIYQDIIFGDDLRQDLRQVPDISRSLTRLSLDRGGPRDLLSLGYAVVGAFHISQKILAKGDLRSDKLPIGLQEIAYCLADLPQELSQKLISAIKEDPPHLIKDGDFIKKGFDADLDQQRILAQESRTIVAQLQESLSQKTQIKSLKIKYNRMLGYFVEVPAAHGAKLLQEPFSLEFIHRQTMANVMRFTTVELSELEGKIARAQDAAIQIENDIFIKLKNEILANTNVLRLASDAFAKLDVTIALGRLAAQSGFCRPIIDNSIEFKIVAGRHPVVEKTLKDENKIFVSNDCDLSGSNNKNEAGQLWLLTGPNMGGKSTFLRQNALIAIMAQMGSFVPANSAHIGIVDRVFSRVGASDDIASGRSTFMVEMVETAAILNKATKKSLVILDEIGRGTATFDGLSIAWASAEALSQVNKCRALFATHFHEMSALAKIQTNTSNHTLKVKEYKGEVVFLHEVEKGAADRSYGISVAKLAGLPQNVLARAKEILNMLEQSSSEKTGLVLDDLPLFTHKVKEKEVKKSEVVKMLENLEPDNLTPRDAVEFLYELKKAHDGKAH